MWYEFILFSIGKFQWRTYERDSDLSDPIKAGNFLTSWAIINFSEDLWSTELHLDGERALTKS
jgi:hypothetical protein